MRIRFETYSVVKCKAIFQASGQGLESQHCVYFMRSIHLPTIGRAEWASGFKGQSVATVFLISN